MFLANGRNGKCRGECADSDSKLDSCLQVLVQRGEASCREGVLRVARRKADREERTVTVLTSFATVLGCNLDCFACVKHSDGEQLWQVRSLNDALAALGCGNHMLLHPHRGFLTH